VKILNASIKITDAEVHGIGPEGDRTHGSTLLRMEDGTELIIDNKLVMRILACIDTHHCLTGIVQGNLDPFWKEQMNSQAPILSKEIDPPLPKLSLHLCPRCGGYLLTDDDPCDCDEE
jgi:hypothetical protein